jgi:hypothetical protein
LSTITASCRASHEAASPAMSKNKTEIRRPILMTVKFMLEVGQR